MLLLVTCCELLTPHPTHQVTWSLGICRSSRLEFGHCGRSLTSFSVSLLLFAFLASVFTTFFASIVIQSKSTKDAFNVLSRRKTKKMLRENFPPLDCCIVFVLPLQFNDSQMQHPFFVFCLLACSPPPSSCPPQDDQNASGAHFNLKLRKRLVSKLWEDLVLAIVGNQFPFGEEVCGAMVSVRPRCDVLQLWVRDQNNDVALTKIRCGSWMHFFWQQTLVCPHADRPKSSLMSSLTLLFSYACVFVQRIAHKAPRLACRLDNRDQETPPRLVPAHASISESTLTQ